jgi:hypothetical protein
MKNYILLSTLLLINFLSLAQPSNDERINSIVLTNTSNWKSADGAYSNVGATGLGFDGSPWGVNQNVWFKFQATTSEIDVRLLYKGSKGTLMNPVLKLFTQDGVEVSPAGNNHSTTSTNIYIQNLYMAPGEWYYFSVDKYTGDPGTFTLEVKDHIGYDLKAKAEVISHSWTMEMQHTATSLPPRMELKAVRTEHRKMYGSNSRRQPMKLRLK